MISDISTWSKKPATIDNRSSSYHELEQAHCQNNFKAPTLDEEVAQLSGTEFTPLGEGGGAVQLENFAAVKMALLIEMIVYG